MKNQSKSLFALTDKDNVSACLQNTNKSLQILQLERILLLAIYYLKNVSLKALKTTYGVLTATSMSDTKSDITLVINGRSVGKFMRLEMY